ncbi:hypothetical protein DH2020_019198 [Rehmannia glutinosa]|uniref:Uncharacterized protein n=1 Tax=Rehmannia glutinosa TaxID=99300 RepID=A0ABR0WMY8_REHGL
MADAAVSFLLENVSQLLMIPSYADRILGSEDELQKLKNELDLLKGFLQDAATKAKKENEFREMESQIKEVVYEVEDTIDTCLTNLYSVVARDKSSLRRRDLNPKAPVMSLAQELRSLREHKLKPIIEKVIKEDFAGIQVGEDEPRIKSQKFLFIRPDDAGIKDDQGTIINKFGFEDDRGTLINYLTEEKEELDAISIVGMAGLGKSTLALSIYQNQKIQYEFPTRVWVNMSEELNMKNVLLNILKKLTSEDMSNLSYQDLHETVYAHLKQGKFLLVLDDVRSVEAWNAISNVLPKSNRMTKVLITSRHLEVARRANPNREPHCLRFLTEEESWVLLQLQVFRRVAQCPLELEGIGKYIAVQCNGLPLAVVVIGGILRYQFATERNMNEIRDTWLDMSKNVEVAIGEQNLFKEIKMSEEGVFVPPVSDIPKYRRLCIHSDPTDFLSTEPKGPRVRSLLCFNKEPTALNPKYSSAIPDGFKLLRVLDSQSIIFHQFPKRVTQLIHLRYITLSGDNLHVLPEAISELWNLQTIIVDTKSRHLTVKANMWRMIQLRHLKTTATIILDIQGESGEAGGENLQTLTRLSPEHSTKYVFRRARNLKTLVIFGILSSLQDATSLQSLDRLENLKLVNDLFYESTSERMMNGLRQPNCFPPHLKKLTLSATFLDWRHISTLAKIDTLQILKLKNNAVSGISWRCVGYGFRSLVFLLIVETDLVYWEASTDHFQGLGVSCLRTAGNSSRFQQAWQKASKKSI